MKPSLRKLLDKKSKAILTGNISEATVEAVFEAIESAQHGVLVKAIEIRRSTEPEDPGWDEFVFDVHVDANPPEALAFWRRIGSQLDTIMDKSEFATRQQLEELISVHVLWR